ncbi:uncharacterized protein LOC144923463 isoform X3 [Branchiostoma floridae x Branchiostoma belcheri]
MSSIKSTYCGLTVTNAHIFNKWHLDYSARIRSTMWSVFLLCLVGFSQHAPAAVVPGIFQGPQYACPGVMCDVWCPFGHVQEDNGCDTCACNNAPQQLCTPVMCEMYCPNGWAQDENGCDVCSCDDTGSKCPPLPCDVWCPYGHVQDDNGCDTCMCNEAPVCPDVMCGLWCPNGVLQDENGCDTCRCDWDGLMVG